MTAQTRRFSVKHTISGEVTIDVRDIDLMRGKWYLRITYGRASVFHFEEGPDGKERKRSLHHIIAERHIPRPSPEHTVVEALDGNKLNCTAANLEWRRRDDTDFKRRRAPGAEVEEAPRELTAAERHRKMMVRVETAERIRKDREAFVEEFMRGARPPAK